MSQPIDPAVQAQIDAAVAQAVAEATRGYEQRIADLQRGQIVPSPVTEFGGGVGTDIAPTWSQYEQELARAGLHPSQQ